MALAISLIRFMSSRQKYLRGSKVPQNRISGIFNMGFFDNLLNRVKKQRWSVMAISWCVILSWYWRRLLRAIPFEILRGGRTGKNLGRPPTHFIYFYFLSPDRPLRISNGIALRYFLQWYRHVMGTMHIEKKTTHGYIIGVWKIYWTH